jgi:hypothetical protein
MFFSSTLSSHDISESDDKKKTKQTKNEQNYSQYNNLTLKNLNSDEMTRLELILSED